MIKLTYSIQINASKEHVYNSMLDKSVYKEWTKAWGPNMTYEGVWKVGEYVSFFDDTQGGTKVRIEHIEPYTCIKVRHVAMVNPQNVEAPLSDDMMKKWIGSLEEYHFNNDGGEQTTVEIVMQVDEAFKNMFDATWPKALQLLKEICER